MDTNILRGFKLDSVSSDLLKTIRAAGVESVGVPWVVLEELASHRAVPYREKHEAAVRAWESFSKATPWQVDGLLPSLDLERFQQHWREQYLEIVDEIQTSEAALREATFRESNVLPPCKAIVVNERGDQVKTGGRDAAIWLTAVEYAREHPEETVYFVSKNTADFGDGTAYPSPMDKDLEGIEDRFVHLTSLGEVVKMFTVPTKVDEGQVRAILSGPESLEVISAEAARKMEAEASNVYIRLVPKFEGAMAFLARDAETGDFETVTTEPVHVRGWTGAPSVAFNDIGELSAYRIGDHVWCAATVRWILSGPAVLDDTLRVEGVGCAWDTRVLASTTQSDSRLTVLRSQATRPLSTEEFLTFTPPPASLAERVEQARRVAPWLQRSGPYETFEMPLWGNSRLGSLLRYPGHPWWAHGLSEGHSPE
ncbi:PIN domain-containing protein [Streptomyces sp. NPDC007905]|uniref:PIN domain-containing protein n=1 Tax=Streptomyces sp. NPDC007905 TaxID=3364788 RepID=UPI0036E6B9DE